MNNNFTETTVGAIVLLVAAYFLYYAYGTTQGNNSVQNGYTVVAKFDRVDGLNPGSDVKISGIKVGKVTSFELDTKSFRAVLNLSLRNDIQLPSDTSAEIIGNGLLGEKYVALVPGADEEKIPTNGQIEFTQSSISLESLIGKFMFDSAEKAGKDESK